MTEILGYVQGKAITRGHLELLMRLGDNGLEELKDGLFWLMDALVFASLQPHGAPIADNHYRAIGNIYIMADLCDAGFGHCPPQEFWEEMKEGAIVN